jgi:hypothetical protein
MPKVKYTGKVDLIYNERLWKAGDEKEVSEAELKALVKNLGFEPAEAPKAEAPKKDEEVEGVEE